MTEQFRHRTPVKVRFNETDLQGHVNFGHYLFYFDIGLTEYFEAIGYDYQSMVEDGTDLLYVESHCNYKSPAKWPEVLDIKTRVADLGRRSIRFEFEVTSQTDDRLVATGHVVAVTAAKDTWEPCRVPNRLREAIEAYENGS
ncbi:MAG: acyl-CoA thioesterase [Anaerolineales bacterium]